eukprot:jgi/Bigna1/82284/fgenesh1_pg.90_\
MVLRKGTPKARKLFKNEDQERWNNALQSYIKAVKQRAQGQKTSKHAANLVKDDEWWRERLPKIIANDRKIAKPDLERVMRWKLARGKFRPTLPALIRRNTQESIAKHSAEAFSRMENQDLKGAIKSLCELSGVGAATASAILACRWPKQAPFMADEAMEADPRLGERKYSLGHYLKFADSMNNKAKVLGSSWSAELIGRALWAEAHLEDEESDGMKSATG